jgi:hypothetical protein
MPSRYHLITTILDREKASAEELAALYHERWEIESALDEVKTHLRGSKIVLRSKTPDLVHQEFYGLMMAHFAIRALMHEATLRADEDPDRLSFLNAVRVIRRKLPVFAAIPPWPPPGSPHSRPSGSGCVRSDHSRRHRVPTRTGSARWLAARTIPWARGRMRPPRLTSTL